MRPHGRSPMRVPCKRREVRVGDQVQCLNEGYEPMAHPRGCTVMAVEDPGYTDRWARVRILLPNGETGNWVMGKCCRVLREVPPQAQV